MPLNDGDEGSEFSSELQDEDIFDAHPRPGIEMLGMAIEPDRGSGSYAEDGPLEVAEDRVMMDGETQLGSAAMYGPTEIGENVLESQYEIGSAAMYGPSEIGAASAAERMAAEIGAAEAADRYAAEIGMGLASHDGPSEIGNAGYIAHDGPSEIGLGEIEPDVTPFDLFMAEPTRMGGIDDVGSAAMYGPSEIGAAVARVIEKARDNRQPPPPMQAVDPEAPESDLDDWGLTDVVIGAAAATGADPFPLTSQLLLRAGAATEPRFVRVDTEASYRQFRVENSPELAELSRRVEEHIADPDAHDLSSAADLSEDIDELVQIGAAAEAEKRVGLWMPSRFDGKVEAWREGDFVCASIALPGHDGELRICTSLEPIRKCVAEMARHAAESGVPASAVVGVLPAMGCVLGAGTAIKEMAAAAPSILKYPAAAGQGAFVVRIEPKVSPGLAALAMLAWACKEGNQQACAEWRRLGEMSAGPVKQAMADALQLVKAAA